MGALKYVKLRFYLRVGKEEVKQNVEIAPPERSDCSTSAKVGQFAASS
jgi:hypothetical protein